MNNKISFFLILMIGFHSCGINKKKLFGIYKTEKENVRQMTLELKPDYSYILTHEASMLYDSIYGKFVIKENEIILFSERKEDILHKAFSDSVKVTLLNQKKVQILNQELKKRNRN